MDRHTIDRLEEFLKNEGFSGSSITRSSVSQTLTAAKGEVQIVVHLTEGVALSDRAEAITDTPAHLIAVRPMVPGFRAETDQGAQPASAAGISQGSSATSAERQLKSDG